MEFFVGLMIGLWLHWCLSGQNARVTGKTGEALVVEYNGVNYRLTKLE